MPSSLHAQTCPQCGAAITFPEHQAQTTCTHCGTVVQRQALSQAAPRYARLDELPPDVMQQLKTLVWDGRRGEALALIQHNLGCAATTAEREVERLVAYTMVPELDSQAPLTRLETIILTALPLLVGVCAVSAGVPALAILIGTGNVGEALLVMFTSTGFFGLFGLVVLGILVAAAHRSIWQSLRLLWGKATPAVIEKMTLLASASLRPIESKQDYGYYGLDLQLGDAAQTGRAVRRIIYVPHSEAQRLGPGRTIEAKCRGADYVYPSIPLKVLRER